MPSVSRIEYEEFIQNHPNLIPKSEKGKNLFIMRHFYKGQLIAQNTNSPEFNFYYINTRLYNELTKST